MRRGKEGFAVAAALAIAVGLVGCSAPKAPPASPDPASGQVTATAASASSGDQTQVLERVVASTRTTLPQLKAAMNGLVSDITVDAQAPDTLVFTYTFASPVQDVSAAASNMNALVPTLQTSVDTLIEPGIQKAGATGPVHVEFVYLNPDGSTVWSKTIN